MLGVYTARADRCQRTERQDRSCVDHVISKTGPNILPEDLFKFLRPDDKHVGMIWQSYVIRSDFFRTGHVFVENFLNLIIGQHSARDMKSLLCRNPLVKPHANLAVAQFEAVFRIIWPGMAYHFEHHTVSDFALA